MNANWTRFNRYLHKYWRLQAMVILFGLITVPLSLLNPYLTKLIIDRAYGNKDLKLFLILALIGGTIFVFNVLLRFRRFVPAVSFWGQICEYFRYLGSSHHRSAKMAKEKLFG